MVLLYILILILVVSWVIVGGILDKPYCFGIVGAIVADAICIASGIMMDIPLKGVDSVKHMLMSCFFIAVGFVFFQTTVRDFIQSQR